MRWFWILALAAPAMVMADDGAFSLGPNPQLMTENPNVAMQKEIVKIDVWLDYVNVRAKFWFHNRGPATQVRMGFPDTDLDYTKAQFYAMTPERRRQIAHGEISNFKALVDGQLVSTDHGISWDEPAQSYFFKTVAFKAHSTRVVEDRYQTPLSSVLADKIAIANVTYVMSTGGTWNGPIGHATVEIKFHGWLRNRLKLKPGKQANYAKGETSWEGFTTPVVSGNTIRFERSSFKPGKPGADISLAFSIPIPTGTDRGG